MPRWRHLEIWSSGIDESLQLLGGDPYHGISGVGLRVPTLPTPPAPVGLDLRYLFNLASIKLADGQKGRIVGFRQLWSLGVAIPSPVPPAPQVPPRVVEQLVTTPTFKLADGNVSWHMRVIGSGEVPPSQPAPINPALRDFVFRMSDGPALLYQAATVGTSPFYVNLTAYTPPNKGRPWGVPMKQNFGTFVDLKTDWLQHGAWHSLDVPMEGDNTYAFFASVRQTNPATRRPLTPPSPFLPNGLSDEEQFLLNFPAAIIWRVGGALVVELDD